MDGIEIFQDEVQNTENIKKFIQSFLKGDLNEYLNSEASKTK